MKENTKRILTWLYSEDVRQPFFADYVQLTGVVPELSAGGLRSVVKWLSDQQLIAAERVGRQTRFRITQQGLAAVKQAFPVFSDQRQHWHGEWSCLIFLQAPAGDKSFRYLRQKLVEYQALPLSRGVYLYPGIFPPELQHLFHQLYLKSLAVYRVGEWTFGDERSVIMKGYMLSDVAETYSGISKEIDQLLEVKKRQKGLNSANRTELFSVFARLHGALSLDLGLVAHYFPQVDDGISLLSTLHSLM